MQYKTLTEGQISDLFLFCEENEIKFYDVQIEMVDHLASAIEQKWAENPGLTYEDALWSVYDDFGASGFRKIRTVKEKALQRKYNRIQWSHIADFFRLPKIILTLASCFAMFLVFKHIDGDYRIVFSILGLFIVGVFTYYLFYFQKTFRIETNTDKNFAMLDYFKHLKGQFIYYAVFPPFNFLIWSYVLFNKFEISSGELFLRDSILALFFVLWFLLMYVFGYFLPKRIVADFRNEFPQFCVD
jgi:hypothetical protein